MFIDRKLAFATAAAILALSALAWLGDPLALSSGNTTATIGVSGFYTSLALDTSGRPVVSYQGGPTQDIKHQFLGLLRCGNPSCTSGNTLAVADGTVGAGRYTSVALDAAGNAVVSYTGSANTLKVLHCANSTCFSGTNSMVTPGPSGGPTSLALDTNGIPVVSVGSAILHCGDANCSSGNSIAYPDSNGGYTSLKLDASGHPVVSGYDSANKDLKVLHCGDANCSSGNTIVSPDTAGDVGSYSSLALDASGHPVVSYYDATNGRLKVLHCGDAFCISGNVITSPDAERPERASVAVDVSGNPVIAYIEWPFNFRVLHCGNPACTAGNVVSAPDASASAGYQNSIVLDGSGDPVVSYWDSTYGLKVLHCGDANCGAAAKPTATPTITPTPVATPTPCSPCPLNFSIGVDVNNDGIDDCNTRTGPVNCSLVAGDSFRVRVSVDTLPPGLTYQGWDAKLSWSGNLAYLTGTMHGTWPDQPSCGAEFLSGMTVTTGCFNLNANSTYTGMLAYTRLYCVQGQANTISLDHSQTDVFNGQTYYESPNPGDVLTISCPQTSVGGIARLSGLPRTALPRTTASSGGVGDWAKIAAAAAGGLIVALCSILWYSQWRRARPEA